MDWKLFCTRLAGLVLIALLAGPAFAMTVHFLIFLNLIPADATNTYGHDMTIRATYVWMGCVLLGFISLFLKESWRNVLYLSPLIAPPLFAIAFTLAQG